MSSSVAACLAGAYIAPMSHLDLTFMGTIEECLSRGAKVFSAVLELLDSQPEFHFFLEYALFLEAYRAVRPEEAARLDAYIRSGRVEMGAEWSGIYVAQEDEEDLIRNVLYAKRYARERYGIELETLQLTDIPGVVPQLPQLCAGLGIQHLVLTRCAPRDTLFWYEAPTGTRVLVWSADSYNQAGRYGLHLGVPAMRARGLAERLATATRSGVPPLLYYGADLYLPPAELAAAVRDWNAEALPGAQLAITTPTAYLRALRAAGIADQAPVLRGELPSTWLYAEPNHAHVSRWDGPVTRALDAAERFSTLAWLHAGRPYPKTELAALWQAQLVARDHNYGGRGAGSGQPRKLAERRQVWHRAQVVLSQALAALAERVQAPRESVPVVVFNALNWERTDVVHAHVTLYPGADPAQRDLLPRGSVFVLRDPEGRPLPYQVTGDRRDTLGEFDLAFLARDVPGLGYASYTLEPTAPTDAAGVGAQASVGGPRAIDPLWFEATSPQISLDNGLVRLALDRTTGHARLLSLGETAAALRPDRDGSAVVVEGLRLQGREELPEICRAPVRALSYDNPAREQVVAFVPAGEVPVQVVSQGPVLATASVRGSVLGAPTELRYTLYRELPWMDLEVRIDWDLRRFGRVELAYDVPLPGASTTYGLPFGAGAFGDEHLLPGSGPLRGDEAERESWARTREISRWLDVASAAGGVAMATDHRWTRVDETAGQEPAVRCCLVRGGRMRPAEPLLDGEDPRARLVFRFRFCPHANAWQAARVPRLGWEAVQPLLTYTVNDTWSPKSLPRRQALVTLSVVSGEGDALLTCLKQADAGESIVARWYEAAGNACDVRMAMPVGAGPIHRVDLLERPLTDGRPTAGEVAATAPWEIVTVRAATSAS